MSDPESSPAPDAPCVLVVEDDPQILRLLTRLLERRGFRVLAAADGDRALELLEGLSAPPDAAFLDVLIPPAGVDPLLSRIAGLGEDVGVVLNSGDELPPALRDRLEALGGVFLRKPFSPKAAHEALLRVTASAEER